MISYIRRKHKTSYVITRLFYVFCDGLSIHLTYFLYFWLFAQKQGQILANLPPVLFIFYNTFVQRFPLLFENHLTIVIQVHHHRIFCACTVAPQDCIGDCPMGLNRLFLQLSVGQIYERNNCRLNDGKQLFDILVINAVMTE